MVKTSQLHKKKFIIATEEKTRRCKYCGKAVRSDNQLNCCGICRKNETKGYFIIKQIRKENGIED